MVTLDSNAQNVLQVLYSPLVPVAGKIIEVLNLNMSRAIK